MITEHEFQRVAAYVKNKAGINLNEKKVLVQGRLDSYMQRKGYSSYDAFMDRVEKFPTGPEAEDLLNALTTNHTYFGGSMSSLYFENKKFFLNLRHVQKIQRTGTSGVRRHRQGRSRIHWRCFVKIFWDWSRLNGIQGFSQPI